MVKLRSESLNALRAGVVKVWLDRLPPEYRRRYYTNLAVIIALLLFFFNVGRLGKRNGVLAILALFGAVIVFTCVRPLFYLLQSKPRPHPRAFVLYGAWIAAFAYVAAAAFVHGLPFAGIVMQLGVLLMLVFLFAYRKIVFPDLFGGQFRERFQLVREAQRAGKKEMESLVEPLRRKD